MILSSRTFILESVPGIVPRAAADVTVPGKTVILYGIRRERSFIFSMKYSMSPAENGSADGSRRGKTQRCTSAVPLRS